MLKDLAIQDGFICDHCEMPLPQSPTWEEFCVYCTIEMLRNDIEINEKASKVYKVILTWEEV